jgi:hypothetical protein
MAQAEFTPPILRVAAPKPKMTIYYALLILALLAMLTACLFLYLEIRRFGGFGTVPQRIASLDQPAQSLLAKAVGRTILSVTLDDGQDCPSYCG